MPSGEYENIFELVHSSTEVSSILRATASAASFFLCKVSLRLSFEACRMEEDVLRGKDRGFEGRERE